MPKRFSRNNPETPQARENSVSKSRTGTPSSARAPQSVNNLLSRLSQSTLARVAEQRQKQGDWREWLRNKLPQELDAHITGAVERDETLTVFADSAAWSARLRFAVAECEKEIHAQNAAIRKVVVKVMPRR